MYHTGMILASVLAKFNKKMKGKVADAKKPPPKRRLFVLYDGVSGNQKKKLISPKRTDKSRTMSPS